MTQDRSSSLCTLLRWLFVGIGCLGAAGGLFGGCVSYPWIVIADGLGAEEQQRPLIHFYLGLAGLSVAVAVLATRLIPWPRTRIVLASLLIGWLLCYPINRIGQNHDTIGLIQVCFLVLLAELVVFCYLGERPDRRASWTAAILAILFPVLLIGVHRERRWYLGLEPRQTWADFNDRINTLTGSPNGRYLAAGRMAGHLQRVVISGDPALPPTAENAAVVVWEFATHRVHWSTPAAGVCATAFSPDSQLLAFGGYDRAVHVVELGTGQQVRSLPPQAGWITALAFDPTGKVLAAGESNGRIHLLNLAGGPDTQLAADGQDRKIEELVFSPDGKILAAADNDCLYQNNAIALWEIEPGDTRRPPRTTAGRRLHGHSHCISSLLFLPDGLLLSGGRDGKLIAWEPSAGAQLRVFFNPLNRWGMNQSIDRTALSVDGQKLAVASLGKILLIDSATFALLDELDTADRLTWSLAFAPDDKSLLTGDDQAIRAWHLDRQPSVLGALVGLTFLVAGYLLFSVKE